MSRAAMVGLVAAVAFAAASAQAADAVMGDWEGTWTAADGKQSKLVAQVIALGDGKYRANLLDAFDQRVAPIVVLEGNAAGDTATFAGQASKGKLQGTTWKGAVGGEEFTGTLAGAASGTFAMRKVVRLSPTLGAKPPKGAVVLFDGTSVGSWVRKGGQPCRWKLVEGGAMEVAPRSGGIISKRAFTDHKLHVEFRTPFEPKKRGQGRGNSGVYLQGRYEVQVLDSYGLEGRSNECGGVYGVGAPRVNMCAPPLQWQTYDITFTAPRFDQGGKLFDQG